MANMTIGECKKAVLRLLNQYSIAGSIVPSTYNDQSDDLARMVDLINDAQMEIATVARPLHAFTDIVVPEVPAGTPLADIETVMPSDFNHAQSVRFKPLKGMDRRLIESPIYKWLGDDILLVPNQPAGTYNIEYTRWPMRYDSNVDESIELDNTPDTHVIIPYYVAAMIALDDNPKAYYALYNVWETRLSRLNIHDANATITMVDDVYGFSSFRGLC